MGINFFRRGRKFVAVADTKQGVEQSEEKRDLINKIAALCAASAEASASDRQFFETIDAYAWTPDRVEIVCKGLKALKVSGAFKILSR